MSYNELLEVRQLFRKIPSHVLNQTHRLIITTHVQYESKDKGSFQKPALLQAELGLGARAYLQNLHYLGTGSSYKKETGNREPCANPKCAEKELAHLRIIRTKYYARSGRAQNYRIDMAQLRVIASMHDGAPFPLDKPLEPAPSDALHAPVRVEPAPSDQLARTDVHPYIHNKQLNRTSIDSNYLLVLDNLKEQNLQQYKHERFAFLLNYLPEANRFTFNRDIDNLYDTLEHLGTSLLAIGELLETLAFDTTEQRTEYVKRCLHEFIGSLAVSEKTP
jgi:hypothetical protein